MITNPFTIALIVLYFGAFAFYLWQGKPLMGALMLLYGICTWILDRLAAG